MDFQNKKFVVSYSGGKDCNLAVCRAIQMGMIPMGMITTYNIDKNRSWFHGIPQTVLNDVGNCLGMSVSLIRTSGEDYRENFVQELHLQKSRGATVCIFGDIDIDGHLDWCTQVCLDAGLEPYFPLWHESREALVRETILRGFDARITVIDTRILSPDLLGMPLSLSLMDTIRSQGADVCGENGEYHTFVCNGPTFSRPVSFSFGQPLYQGHYAVLPIQADE